MVAPLIGLLTGMVPYVNEHLHWNIWVVLPITGILLGAGMAYVQFEVGKALNLRFDRSVMLKLVCCCVLGYLATDIGCWLTINVDGEPVRSYLTLFEYFKHRVFRSGLGPLKIGTTLSFLSFAADYVGLVIGSGGILFLMAEENPYCGACKRYLVLDQKVDLDFAVERGAKQDFWTVVVQSLRSNRFAEVAAALNELPLAQPEFSPKLEVRELVCLSCHRRSIDFGIQRKDDRGEWLLEGQIYQVLSDSGAAPGLLRR